MWPFHIRSGGYGSIHNQKLKPCDLETKCKHCLNKPVDSIIFI